MDTNNIIKEKKERESRLYDNYVLCDDFMKSLYFKVIPMEETKANYSESWNKPHFHGFYMIQWFESGKGIQIVDSEEYTIKEGRMFFSNPNKLHLLKNDDLIDGVAITFSEKIFDLICPRLADYIKYEIFSRQGKCLFCDTNKEADNVLEDILKQMALESKKTESYGYEYIVSALFTEFVIQAERLCNWSQNVQRNINSTSYQTYLNFISLIDANFKEEKKVEWYTRKMGISVVLLSRYVKKYNCDTNITPLKMINNRVFIEAERMLRHSNESVSRIAYHLGFEDDSNFIKFFKKLDKKQRTPKQYRENWQV